MNVNQKYYGKGGAYLKDYKNYFSDKILKRDINFIIQSLKLTKKDECLDLQCAQGRFAIELSRRGYDVDGLDLSGYLINLCRSIAKEKNLKANFFVQNLNNLNLTTKYSKVFMVFPDWTDLNLKRVLPNISKIIKKGGLFLYDHDNLFRVWNYLETNPKERNKFTFNPTTMMLKGKGDKKGDRYYTYLEIEDIFKQNGLKIVVTYGNWTIKNGEYNFNSPRLRIVAKKI